MYMDITAISIKLQIQQDMIGLKIENVNHLEQHFQKILHHTIIITRLSKDSAPHLAIRCSS